MKPVLLETLKASLIGDNVKLAEASQTIMQLAKNDGYCVNLMQIVDDGAVDVSVKQAALIQLKNTIKARWKPKSDKQIPLNSEEKNIIKNALVMAVIRCAKIHKLIKLYRQVITIIIYHQHQQWLPHEQLVGFIDKNQNLQPCMECLIAIATNFQFSIVPKDRNFYNQFLIFILPKILAMVNNNKGNPELVYLSLKFLWKSVHYDLSKQAKYMCLNWMQLLLSTITAYNESCQVKVEEIHHKYTLDFYYFHSKKWATRILLRFLQKHAKDTLYGHQVVQNHQFTEKWHTQYGHVFLKALIAQMSVPTIKKVRYFQFKCIQAWTTERPALLKEYVSGFQYQILPQYLKVKLEDENLANNDPLQFLAIEEEPCLSFTNLKRAATDLWIAMFQIESRTDLKKKLYVPGPYFNENLAFLVNNLNGNNLIDKEYSLYLLCEIRYLVVRNKEALQQLLLLFPTIVLPEFKSNVMFLRMRANDIFIQYGRDKYDLEIIEKAAEMIYVCLSSDQSPIVRIKAASAFHNILTHPNAKGLVTPVLKDILQIYLKLIQAYDLQQLVKGLEHIVSNFSTQISPYAIDLFKYLSQLFIKLFQKDQQLNKNNDDYEGQTQLTASGCLKTMAQIIASPLSQQMRMQLQENVLQMCYFVLCQESSDYSEDILGLLNVHLYKMRVISPSLWFFFQVIIYFIVGIPKQFWDKLQKTQMPEKFKKILMNIKDSENYEYFEFAVPVIRNYISKFKTIQNKNQQFKINFTHIIFYMIGCSYKAHNKEENSSQMDLDCCTIILIYMIEECEQDMISPLLVPIWTYCKYNLIKSTSSQLRLLASMLLGVLFWKYPQNFMNILLGEKALPFAINSMIKYHQHLEETYERKRIILGIVKLLNSNLRPAEMMPCLQVMFKGLLKLLKSNADYYIIKYMEKNKLKNEDMGINENEEDDDDEEDIYKVLPNDDNVDYEDEEDMWDQAYYSYYNSPLQRINEIAYFKQTMIWLKDNQSNFYNMLIPLVPTKQLSKIDKNIEKALTIMQQTN